MAVSDRLLSDIDLVRSQGHNVEVIEDGTRFYVVLSNFVLPNYYNPSVTDLMVMADYQYPVSALDMFWTEPHIRCPNGAWPQSADQFEPHLQRIWQRWSWHYVGWNPASHTVATHIEVCLDRLSKVC